MHALVLATKLYVPPPRPDAVVRPRLLARLDEGRRRKLTLVSAPAGFGKTTLVSGWVAGRASPVAWLSLDEEHNDLARFLIYLVAALRDAEPGVGDTALPLLSTPQPPPADQILATLINDLEAVTDLALVFDDYHAIASASVDRALGFLVEHLPPQVHLVVATRAEPDLPLARLRARDQLVELHALDLEFTPAEATEFLDATMGLDLAAADVAALERRTEGWIAGLHLAAVSLRGQGNAAHFIASFTGSHRFVLDYLAEEVLHGQGAGIRDFLLRSSILDRLCGPLCDAVVANPGTPGQQTLEYLEGANLFVVPLDDERKWYRYHHLFRDVLRQRLLQKGDPASREGGVRAADLHGRASSWFEANGFELDAFLHAASADDLDRAERLIAGTGMPLYFRGAGASVLTWLESLPEAELVARPALRVALLTLLTFAGRAVSSVEEQLDAAEAALTGSDSDESARNELGHIAALRAMLAIPHSRGQRIVAQSRRALELLHPDNQPIRTTAIWTLGFGSQLCGDHDVAKRSYTDAISLAEASSNTMAAIAAYTSLGQLQESEGDLSSAVDRYRRVVELAGDPPLPAACEAHLGLARVLYAWNDLDAAQVHGASCRRLAPQLESVGTPASCGVFLARIRLARGDLAEAASLLEEAEAFVRRNGFEHLEADIAATRASLLLRQGDAAAAAHVVHTYDLPISKARIHLARSAPSAARQLLGRQRRQAASGGMHAELLETLVLQSLASVADGSPEEAMEPLAQAIALAEPSGFVRVFVDEGLPMARLVFRKEAREIAPRYVDTLRAAFAAESDVASGEPSHPLAGGSTQRFLYEPLTEIELKVLRLVAEGLSNEEIGERIHRAVSTIKGHNRVIFAKLQVERRTEAVARARELGLL